MFNKQERTRREAAQKFHQRRYDMTMRAVDGPAFDANSLERLNGLARFHRKQAELWEKHVKTFDMAALRTAKLVGRK